MINSLQVRITTPKYAPRSSFKSTGQKKSAQDTQDIFITSQKSKSLFFKGGADDVWSAVQNKNPIPHTLSLLGAGVESHVYKVSDNFVFRVPRNYEGKNWNLTRNNLVDVADDKKELRRVENIGKPVAKMFYDGKPIYFHKLMSGERASIPYYKLDLDGTIPYFRRDSFKETYSGYLQKISRFPESSYKEYLWAVHQLDKAGYAIDPGANNLIVDYPKQRFSIVDYKETEKALENKMFPENEHNNLAYQMAMILDLQFKEKIRGNWDKDSSEDKLCREILKKMLCAAADLKYSNKASVKLPSSSTFHLRHTQDQSCNSFTPQKIFESCGLEASNWSAIRDALKNQKKECFPSYSETLEVIKSNIKD
jgi:hypothetical protein